MAFSRILTEELQERVTEPAKGWLGRQNASRKCSWVFCGILGQLKAGKTFPQMKKTKNH